MAKKLARIDGVEAPELFERLRKRARSSRALPRTSPSWISACEIPDGLELAERVRELSPRMRRRVRQGYADYAVDAFRIHADGYVSASSVEDLEREIAHARERRAPAERALVRRADVRGVRGVRMRRAGAFQAQQSKVAVRFLVGSRGAERRTCR